MLNEINSYQTYLESKNSPLNTISAYISDVNLFHCFCKDRLSTDKVELELIDSDLIRAYLVNLIGEKKSNRTISRNVTSLRVFYKYLMLYDFIDKNPMKLIKTPKYQRKLPHFFSYEEIKALCELPDLETFSGIRDRTILELFYSSGIRITELVTLTYKNIDFKNNLIQVIGKGSKK